MRPLLLSMLLLPACSPPPYAGDPTTPAIEITWPPPEQVVVGCSMVVVNLQNFTLVESSDELVDGEGHFHVEYAETYALCSKPYCLVPLTGITGPLTLTAALKQNDHSALLDENGLAITHSVPISVEDGPCAEGEAEPYDTGMGDTGGGDTGTGATNSGTGE